MRAPPGGKHDAPAREPLRHRNPLLPPLSEQVLLSIGEPPVDRLLQIDMQEYTITVGTDHGVGNASTEENQVRAGAFLTRQLVSCFPGTFIGADGVKSVQRDLPPG